MNFIFTIVAVPILFSDVVLVGLVTAVTRWLFLLNT